MEDFSKILEQLKNQEEMIQFTEFTNKTASQLGMNLIDKAKSENISITIDIYAYIM